MKGLNMKKHVWIKILSLAIALLMMSATLVACFGGDSAETDGNTNQDETVSTDDSGSNNSAFEISGLPERDYEGEAFVIRYATKTTFVPNTLNVQSHEARRISSSKQATTEISASRSLRALRSPTLFQLPTPTHSPARTVK